MFNNVYVPDFYLYFVYFYLVIKPNSKEFQN